MTAVEHLLAGRIDVLGHPFRVFQRAGRPAPQELFRPVAELLAAHKVAAEINFHTNQPEPEFFALCLERGVKLAVGSDAHALVEVGELCPHLDFLRTLGVSKARFGEALWRPE
jgi:histidinol phosphatase-like PHP family hydrolase